MKSYMLKKQRLGSSFVHTLEKSLREEGLGGLSRPDLHITSNFMQPNYIPIHFRFWTV